jgi:hypothetical protein
VYAAFCGNMAPEQALLEAKNKAQDMLQGN